MWKAPIKPFRFFYHEFWNSSFIAKIFGYRVAWRMCYDNKSILKWELVLCKCSLNVAHLMQFNDLWLSWYILMDITLAFSVDFVGFSWFWDLRAVSKWHERNNGLWLLTQNSHFVWRKVAKFQRELITLNVRSIFVGFECLLGLWAVTLLWLKEIWFLHLQFELQKWRGLSSLLSHEYGGFGLP